MKDQESTIRKRSEPSPEVINAIVERARLHPEAFGELYDIYLDRIFSYVYYRVERIVPDAEDLTGKIFFRALNKLPTYKGKGGLFSAWLLRIAHNCVCNFRRDELRRSRRTISLDHSPESQDKEESGWLWEHIPDERNLSPEEIVINHQKTERVLRVIDRAGLNDSERELLVLKYAVGLPDKEIARSTGKTIGAIKSIHHRILVKLRQTQD